MYLWVIYLVGMPEIPEETKVEEAEETKIVTKPPPKIKPTGPLAFTPEEAKEAMEAARPTLNAIQKSHIAEIKSLSSPPISLKWAMSLVVIFLTGETKPCDWRGAQKAMGNPAAFMDSLQNFDANYITMRMIKACQKIIRVNGLSEETVTPSTAVALFRWVNTFISRAKSTPVQEVDPSN